MTSQATHRIEKDSLGTMEVPASAYYGAQTRRAELNFPISDLRLNRRFLRALAQIKRAAAEVNRDLGLLDAHVAGAIVQAADEVNMTLVRVREIAVERGLVDDPSVVTWT